MKRQAHLAFDWGDPAKSQEEPPGRPIAEALARGLAAAGVRVVDPPEWNGSYGWEFTVETDQGRVWCLLQQSDRWLLIAEAEVPLLRRLFGETGEAGLQAVCGALDRVMASLPQVGHPLWESREEHESRQARLRR